MIRVRTPSRLHFGLFSLPSAGAASWSNREGQATLRRQYGGIGLMIDRPGIDLTVEHAKTWSAEGPLAERTLQFARTYCASAGIQETFRVRVASAAPEHTGLGTGTQLGLAVARSIAELSCQPDRTAVTLAQQVGRGLRSALGVHGFEQGGFLVEGGKTSDASVSPLLSRLDFPSEWGILLILPRDLQGTHGSREVQTFAEFAKQDCDDQSTGTLCRLVLLGMLPALRERDPNTFGEALYDFNQRVGEMFVSAQGGLYAHPRIERIIKIVREAGIKGVGQSSWGPTIFAVVSSGLQAMGLCDWLTKKKKMQHEDLILVCADNQGAIATKTASGLAIGGER